MYDSIQEVISSVSGRQCLGHVKTRVVRFDSCSSFCESGRVVPSIHLCQDGCGMLSLLER